MKREFVQDEKVSTISVIPVISTEDENPVPWFPQKVGTTERSINPVLRYSRINTDGTVCDKDTMTLSFTCPWVTKGFL